MCLKHYPENLLKSKIYSQKLYEQKFQNGVIGNTFGPKRLTYFKL